MTPLSAAEQVLCPRCDPWAEHFWLLIAVFVIGCWCGMVVLSIQRFVSEESREERRREAAYAAEKERLAALRKQVAKPDSGWTEPVTERQRNLRGQHAAARHFDELDRGVDGRPLIDQRARRGRRGS